MTDTIQATTAVRAEDVRIERMREFVAVCDDIDRIREEVGEREHRLKELSGRREEIKRALLGIVDPDSLPKMAEPFEGRSVR